MIVGSRTTIAKPSDRILPLLGSLRPSERRELVGVVQSDPKLFMSALEDFLARWARSTWLEEYNVERIGKWIRRNCPRDVVDQSQAIADRKQAANRRNDSIHDRTYRVFLNGLTVH